MEGDWNGIAVSYFYGNFVKLDRSWTAADVRAAVAKCYYIREGECRFEVEGETFLLGRGDLLLLPPGRRHSFGHFNDNLIGKYWFHFDIKAGGMDFFRRVRLPYVVSGPYDPAVESLFREIFSCAEDGSPAARLNLHADVLRLIALFCERSGCSPSGLESPFSEVIAHLGANLHREMKLDELAGIAGFAPHYFVRAFRQATGLTPIAYLASLRTEEAKRLLANTELPISEVMCRTGFLDHSHFDKFFKKHTGYSPTDYRHSCRESGLR